MKLLQLPNPGNGGGLGNQLFTIASTIGLALRHGYTPRFPADWKYQDSFNVPDEYFGEMLPCHTFKENCYDFDFDLEGSIGISYIKYISISGYLQSPKYWEGYEKEIRQYLTPKGCNPGSRDAVGIHYRRGDYVGNPNYLFLGFEYYVNAARTLQGICFDVIARSDDPQLINEVYGQTCGTELQDFIALAECKEHIISNSTYSWWSAYLSGGKVVAPREWFAGALAKRCSTKDLLPENWIKI
jgi:hypothetical protein